jgi:hypothetical protein
MDAGVHFLRLFDLKKYRNIQSIIESVANQSMDYQQVILLVKEAIKIVKHNDFEKYNDPDERECFLEDLQEILDVLQKKEFFSWFDDERNTYILRNVALLICCPDFQESSTYNEESGTRIDYEDVLYGSKICELDFIEVSENFESGEIISVLSNETKIQILSQKQITEIDKSIHRDTITLIKLENSLLSERHSLLREIYLKFYFNLKNLIDRVKSNNNYTLLNEDILP